MKVEWKSCLKIGVTACAIFLFIHYWDGLIKLSGLMIAAAKPLLVGCLIAYVVNILMRFYENHYFIQTIYQKKISVPAFRPLL